MKQLAPVVLFTYNRPIHTEQTLNALMNNDLARESELYIYCDGPKDDGTEEQRKRIIEVRKIVRKRQWCNKVYIIEHEKNKGLANSVIDGVTEVIEKFGKVIVLEDDLVTSPYFLNYMNMALDYYENKPAVFSISADRPPINKLIIPKDYSYDVFVSLRSFSTGWGTWRNRWGKIDWSLDYLDDFLKSPYQISAFNRGGEDLTNMLILQQESKIDSWSILFSFNHFANHAVAILPCNSYVENIGFDGTGIHSRNSNTYKKVKTSLAVRNPQFIDILYEDKRIINSFYSAYYSKKRSLLKKITNRITRLIIGKNLFILKKKVYE